MFILSALSYRKNVSQHLTLASSKFEEVLPPLPQRDAMVRARLFIQLVKVLPVVLSVILL